MQSTKLPSNRDNAALPTGAPLVSTYHTASPRIFGTGLSAKTARLQKAVAGFQHRFLDPALAAAAAAPALLFPLLPMATSAVRMGRQGDMLLQPMPFDRGAKSFGIFNFRTVGADTTSRQSAPHGPACPEISLPTHQNDTSETLMARFMRGLSLTKRLNHQKDGDSSDRKIDQNHRIQAQKMETLGVLTSGVAHDFNNIIAVINAALDQLESPGTQEHGLQIARHATKRATVIVRKLLSFARQEERQVSDIDHATDIAELISILEPAFGARYRLSYRSTTENWIKADPGLFDATIMNLAINARDAMSNGGDIAIMARDATAEEIARVGGAAVGPMVTLTITDNGEGISPEIAARVFEPFFSTKPAGKGTGLGLSMATSFARDAGGTIFFDTTYQGGARLVLVLPAAEKAPAAEPVQSQLANVTLEGKRILVADDEEALAMMAHKYLTARGAIVSRAGTVTEALNLLKEKPGFDVLLVDLNLPDGTGHEIFDTARSSASSDALFLLTSGNFDTAKAAEGEDGRSVYHIPKPFRLAELSKIILAIFQDRKNAN